MLSRAFQGLQHNQHRKLCCGPQLCFVVMLHAPLVGWARAGAHGSELLGFAALPGIMGISDRPVRIGRPAGAGRFGPLPNTSNSAKQDRPQAKNKFSNGKENFSSKSPLTRKRRLLLR